jgi:drug/metabolite transporter (DMT)-like permease
MLFALKFSKISYAGTARELTIIVGIMWSYFLLREKINLIRIISIFIIFVGAVTISLAK